LTLITKLLSFILDKKQKSIGVSVKAEDFLFGKEQTMRYLPVYTILFLVSLSVPISAQESSKRDAERILRKMEELQNDTSALKRHKPGVLDTNFEFDFRKVNWGTSKAVVRKAEKVKADAEHGRAILYKTIVYGQPATIEYFFAQGKLVRARYTFNGKHTDKNKYIGDYDQIKDSLKIMYGVPTEDTHVWRNDLYQDSIKQWGTAVSLGHVEYWTKWENYHTSIWHSLSGSNLHVILTTEFFSIKLKDLEDKENEKMGSSGF
jgi:hypothetical protein